MSRVIKIAQRVVDAGWYALNRDKAGGGAKASRRNFQSARTTNLTGDWPTSIKSIDAVIDSDLKSLRARSRYLHNNNDYMRRFVGLLVNNVVGASGVTLQAASRDGEKLDDIANQSIEAAFKKWSKKAHCDVAARYSFLMQQVLFMNTIAVDGEYIARKIYGDGEFGFALQVIDPELLDVRLNKKLSGGNYIRHGIEFNEYGRRISYHFLSSDPSSVRHEVAANKYIVVPADEIIHEFWPQQIGQKRGLPMAATAMMRMQMLNGYEHAALTAARVGAAQMGFFKTSEEAGSGGVGSVDENGNPVVDDAGNFVNEVEPGSFQVLPEGYDLAKFDPDYPHSQFGEFVKTCLRGISSGLNVSYNTLANDLEGVNFSSIRQGVLEDREQWKLLQAWMVEAFHDPVYQDWLRYALLNKKITTPKGGALSLGRIEKYKEVRWQARRWQWVDPLRDATTAKLEEEQGWVSKSHNIRSKGGDPVEVARERERDKMLFPDVPVNPGKTQVFSSQDDQKKLGEDDDD